MVFIAMVTMVNYLLGSLIGEWTHANQLITEFTAGKYKTLSLQFILGYLCAPLVWMLGIAKEDIILVGQLLGEKTVLNEFVAYTTLGSMKASQVFQSEKSVIMATYILCGFSNISSIGIQIGGIGALAPNQKKTLSQLGVRALVGGTIATLMTATIVGMLY